MTFEAWWYKNEKTPASGKSLAKSAFEAGRASALGVAPTSPPLSAVDIIVFVFAVLVIGAPVVVLIKLINTSHC